MRGLTILEEIALLEKNYKELKSHTNFDDPFLKRKNEKIRKSYLKRILILQKKAINTLKEVAGQ